MKKFHIILMHSFGFEYWKSKDIYIYIEIERERERKREISNKYNIIL